MRHVKFWSNSIGYTSFRGVWLKGAIASLGILTFSGPSLSKAGHGDAEDAAICQVVSPKRSGEVGLVENLLNNIDQYKANAIAYLKSSATRELLDVLAQDFEMRLCECRSYDIRPMDDQPSIAEDVVEMASRVEASSTAEPIATAIGSHEVSDTYRSTRAYRFTRDDLSMTNTNPFGSFVPKLTIEEYRPYDLLVEQIDTPDFDIGSATTEEFLSHSKMVWAPRVRSETESPVLLDIQSKRELVSQSVNTLANRVTSWMSGVRELVEFRFTQELVSSISSAEQFFSRSQNHLVALSNSQTLLHLSQLAIPGKHVPESTSTHSLANVQLQEVFGATILSNPIDVERLPIKFRPPMLVNPSAVEESWKAAVALPSRSTTDVADVKWEIVVMLQEPSWNFSDTIALERKSEASQELGLASSATQVSREGEDVEATSPAEGELVESYQPEPPTKSATLPENIGNAVSQR